MKSVRTRMALLLLTNFGCFSNLTYARSEEEIEKDFSRAATNAVETYKKEGMSGLTTKTQDCYDQHIENQFFCVYLDIASRHIDQMAVEEMHFPPNEYFADKQFGTRLAPVLTSANMDMNSANTYLKAIIPVINNSVEKFLKPSAPKTTSNVINNACNQLSSEYSDNVNYLKKSEEAIKNKYPLLYPYLKDCEKNQDVDVGKCLVNKCALSAIIEWMRDKEASCDDLLVDQVKLESNQKTAKTNLKILEEKYVSLGCK